MQIIFTKCKLLVKQIVYLWFIPSTCLLDGPNKKKFTILTTTSILRDTIKNIVKEDVDVVSLMGPGIDPHTYQATLKDIQELKQADIVFYNGVYLEGKITNLLENMTKERKIYAASDAIDKNQFIYGDIFPLGVDPHIWFDVKLWKQVVAFISNKLQEAIPDKAAYYQCNTNSYLEELETLDQEITTLIESIPERQRILITAHDAFSYFGRAYHIEVVGLQGISTASECGLNDVQRIVQLIRERGIKAVFFETSVPDKSMRAVLEGAIHYGHKVIIGGSLYSDALGATGTPEGSYCGMMSANVRTIVDALK